MPPKLENRPRDTHFLCFPLVTPDSLPQLDKSLANFRALTTQAPNRHRQPQRDTIENDGEDGGDHDDNHRVQDALKILPFKAHRPAGTLHLTLGVMDLSEPDRMQQAVKLLNSLDLLAMLAQARRRQQPETASTGAAEDCAESSEKVLPPDPAASDSASKGVLDSLTRPITPPFPSRSFPCSPVLSPLPLMVSLVGLSAFSSATCARVLYATPVDPTDRLYHFGLAIREKFREAGLVTEIRPLTLHATVANMRYVAQSRGERDRPKARGQSRGSVDAREMIKAFDEGDGLVGDVALDREEEGYVWARDISVDRVALCKMGAVRSDNELLGMVYPPVSEKSIFERA